MSNNKDSYIHRDVFAPKKRKNRKIFWFISLFVLGGLLIGAAYLVIYAPFLKVQAVNVSGIHLMSPADLTNALSVKLAGENRYLAMLGSDNILFWALSKKPASLAATPQLGNLRIETDLIKRQVSVSAEERQLFGILCEPDASCYGFDKDGVVFSRVPQTQGNLILRIDDQNQRTIILGNKILPNGDWLKNIFATLLILNESNLSVASVGIRPLTLEEWQVNLASEPVFYFSLNFVPQNFDGILKNLLKRLNLAKLQYLDFRVANRIYYK